MFVKKRNCIIQFLFFYAHLEKNDERFNDERFNDERFNDERFNR